LFRTEKIAVATTALLFVPLIVVASVTHDRLIGIVGLAVACSGNATVSGCVVDIHPTVERTLVPMTELE
jgi:hypothetical protein